MIAEILNIKEEGAFDRVTYQFKDGDEVQGPFIDDRPRDEDHVLWVNSRIPVPTPDYRGMLKSILGEEKFNALAAALADEGVETVKLGDVNIRVTASKIQPDDIQARISERVNLQLGDDASYNTIINTLKALNFTDAQLQYESEKVIF